MNFIKGNILCFVMAKSFNTAQKLERYYAVYMLWFTLLGIWGIQQRFGGNPRMEGLGGVVLSDINDLSAVFILNLPMAYYTMFSRKNWIKFFIGIPSFLVFVVVLKNSSTSPIN